MKAIRGDDEHEDFAYVPKDDWIIDLASPGGNWGFDVRQVTTPEGAAHMMRHYSLKHWATPVRQRALKAAIEYWVSSAQRRSRTDWSEDLLTDWERNEESDDGDA